MFNVKSILDLLDKVTDIAKSAAPLATTLGIPFVEKIAGLADTAVDVAKNAIDRVEDVQAGHASTDQADIEARIARLDAANAELHQYVLNS